MPRRDAFSSLRQNDPSGPEGSPQKGGPGFPDFPAPQQPLDLIPIAPTKKKRNRDWDRAHQVEKITYRGIPQPLQNVINDLADSLVVPRDEVVRVLLEFSLAKYQNNELAVCPHPKAQKMTLFPEKGRSSMGLATTATAAAWLNQAFPNSGSRGAKKHSKEERQKPRWQSRATYRLPVSLKDKVKAIADEVDVPVGEVVLLFLDYGLRAYQSGELCLTPSPRSSGQTLFLDD
jgi:hypothetical protein